jgi:hypothetical protein
MISTTILKNIIYKYYHILCDNNLPYYHDNLLKIDIEDRNLSFRKSHDEDESRCSGTVSSSRSSSDALRVTIKWCEHHLKWKWCWTPGSVNEYN